MLLLCLTRTLLPEAWILALHAHAHTTAEPAARPAFKRQGHAQLSAKHQHCAVEKFYTAGFEAAGPVPVPAPRRAPRYAALAPPLPVRALAGRPVRPRALRGPPRRA